MKRYNLCAYDSKTKSQILMGVNVDENGIYVVSGEKSLLSAIDMYSMKFSDEKETIFDLLNVGVLDQDAKLYIRYENNGPKRTTVLYKDADQMLPFAKELATNVSTNTNHFDELFNRMLKASKNIRFMEYMYKYGYINDYLYNKLKDYREKTYSSQIEFDMLTSKIATALSSYKVIRDIYIGTKRYQKGEKIPNTGNTKLPKIYINKESLTDDEKYQLDLYLYGGEEELYNTFDKEQISDKVMKKIYEYRKKGL